MWDQDAPRVSLISLPSIIWANLTDVHHLQFNCSYVVVVNVRRRNEGPEAIFCARDKTDGETNKAMVQIQNHGGNYNLHYGQTTLYTYCLWFEYVHVSKEFGMILIVIIASYANYKTTPEQ